MSVITKEIQRPTSHPLSMPAGLPRHRPRALLTDITAFDQYAGDHSRQILLGVVALSVLAGGFWVLSQAGQDTPASAPVPVPVPVSKTASPPPAAAPALAAPDLEPATVSEPAPALVGELVSEKRLEEGTLELITHPRVVVYAGERRLGRTPLKVSLPAGRQKLRFVSRKNHLEIKRAYRVRPNKTRKLELHFGMSKLDVQAPEGTKIYIDRRLVGRAPLEPISVAEGRHRLKLIKGSLRMTERLYIPPSRTVRYQARFQ